MLLTGSLLDGVSFGVPGALSVSSMLECAFGVVPKQRCTLDGVLKVDGGVVLVLRKVSMLIMYWLLLLFCAQQVSMYGGVAIVEDVCGKVEVNARG